MDTEELRKMLEYVYDQHRRVLAENYRLAQVALKARRITTAYLHLDWIRAHRPLWGDYVPF